MQRALLDMATRCRERPACDRSRWDAVRAQREDRMVDEGARVGGDLWVEPGCEVNVAFGRRAAVPSIAKLCR
jgi:hypothetical protein